MWKKIIFALAAVGLISFFMYRFIGGGEPVEFHLIETPPTRVGGEWFEGRPNSPALEDLFYRMRDQSSFEDSSFLTIVTVPDARADTIRQFIGIMNSSAGKELYLLDNGSYVQADLGMQPALRPSPEKVREGAEKFSAEAGVKISQSDIQVFTSDSGFHILFPVED